MKYRMKPVSATTITYSRLQSKMMWLRDEVPQKVEAEQQFKLQLHRALTTNEMNPNDLSLSEEDGLPGERSFPYI